MRGGTQDIIKNAETNTDVNVSSPFVPRINRLCTLQLQFTHHANKWLAYLSKEEFMTLDTELGMYFRKVKNANKFICICSK